MRPPSFLNSGHDFSASSNLPSPRRVPCAPNTPGGTRVHYTPNNPPRSSFHGLLPRRGRLRIPHPAVCAGAGTG
eukprot:6308894-Pyramimonas_sp.AAC.1